MVRKKHSVLGFMGWIVLVWGFVTFIVALLILIAILYINLSRRDVDI